MSNLVATLYQLIEASESSHFRCGIILVSCKDLSVEGLETVKRDLAHNSSKEEAHYAFDQNTQVLSIFLKHQKLSDTHFHALLVKDYLQNASLLAGSLLIASFEECTRATGQLLRSMHHAVMELAGVGEIKLFDPQAEDAGDSAASILLVNHDETVNEFLSIYLERKGYQVIVANDGVDGVQKYQEMTPDLVITDLNLPIMNGYQMIERIKHSDAERGSKIVILTDKRLEEDVKKSFALGASDYITKPFSPVELAARVKRLIS